MNNPHAPVMVSPEPTPNPNSTRYAVNRTLLEGPGRDFPNPLSAANSLLSRELFLLPNVQSIYIGRDFVTVTTSVPNAWAIPPLVIQCIENHIAGGQPAVTDGPTAAPSEHTLNMSEAALKIIRVLDAEIRPAVAMDGGDIVFNSYENGVLKLQLRGSCHSCPSSLVTLKNGIQARLKKDFPELVSVEAV